jgi:death-on-curing protein
MISKAQIIEIHEILIENFGGSLGIRNEELLESAINRPFQTFDGNELYPSVIEKGSALVESLLINHPFIDGNKRIGYVSLRLFLISNGIDLDATEEEKYDFIISIASGNLKFEGIKEWIAKKSATMR